MRLDHQASPIGVAGTAETAAIRSFWTRIKTLFDNSKLSMHKRKWIRLLQYEKKRNKEGKKIDLNNFSKPVGKQGTRGAGMVAGQIF
jgi:hypothetical protein